MESGRSLVEFIACLGEEGFAARTIRTYAVAISSVAIEDPSTGEKIGQDPDVERILGAVKRHGMRHLKDNTMWDLGEALSEGFRGQELCCNKHNPIEVASAACEAQH